MMKMFTLILPLLSFSALGQKNCSFTRHYHVELKGIDLPIALKNKILSSFNPKNIIVQKTNEEMNIVVCATVGKFLDPKEILKLPHSKEEHVLTKLSLAPDQNGFWLMSVENFMRKDEKEMTSVNALEIHHSPKLIKQMKDPEVVKWVSSNLLPPTSK